MAADQDNFITGIHNYCDRWCEKCAFTARCSVFARQQDFTDDQKDIGSEDYWVNLKSIFSEAKEMVLEKAAEIGFDVEPISDEEFQQITDRQDKFLQEQDLNSLAEKYGRQAGKAFDDKDIWLMFAPLDEDGREQMLEILYWYQYEIAAKIHRGLHGLLDIDGYESDEELNDAQSDANGSIKVALISIERSQMAWTNLLSKENADTVQPLLTLLENIRREAESKFPLARDFVRPGFDEIQIVM